MEHIEKREAKKVFGKEFGIFDFVKYLLQKKYVILLPTLIALFLTTIYVCFITVPIYEATSQIYVVNSQDSVINLSDLQIGSYLTSDYQWVFQVWEVNQTVIDNLNLTYSVKQMRDNLTVKNPSNTRVLTITFASTDAKEAAAVANEYAMVASRYISDSMLTNKPTIISVALEPINPVRPRKALLIAICTFLTCIISIWCLFIGYICDDKLKTADDLKKYMEIDPLAEIPYSGKKRGKWDRV